MIDLSAAPWTALALAATGFHLGFQLTVTALVYPALAATAPDRWREVHDRHSRRITPLVGVAYAAALVTTVGLVVTRPGAGSGTAVAGTLVAVLVTAVAAAPLHGRLGRAGADPALLRRLLAVDRVRSVGALVALAGAVLAGLG